MTTITANVPLLDGTYDITIEGERIAAVTATDAETDLFAGPALFDIQVNGYGGRSCCLESEDKKDALPFITRLFREVGVGWWIPTICTYSYETMSTACRLIAEVLREDSEMAAAIPGIHIEGPYLSRDEGSRGVHPLEHIRPPDWDEFQRMQELAEGHIIYITVAPEVEGAIEFIRKCADSGVVVGMGHTSLERDDLLRAVDAGATLSTHLGNGAKDRIQRHNNFLWYQLANRKTYASFITDGHHLPEDCLYCMLRAKGLDLSVITSDCVSLGGMPPGVYGDVEILPSGRTVAIGTPNLAGGTNNQKDCVERVIALGKVSHAQGWALGSTQPAKVFGMDNRLGIEAGKEATLTVYHYDEDGPKIDVLETWVAGQRVYEAEVTEKTPLPAQPLDQNL